MSATYQGKPCLHGHSGLRYKSTRACVACLAARHEERTGRTVAVKPGSAVDKAKRMTKARPVASRPATRSQQRRAPKIQGETLGEASAPSPVAGGPLDVQSLGEALACAMLEVGRSHVAVTRLEGGLWQAVTLRPGYRDQVTRTGRTAGEALQLALTGSRGRSDELLDVVG